MDLRNVCWQSLYCRSVENKVPLMIIPGLLLLSFKTRYDAGPSSHVVWLGCVGSLLSGLAPVLLFLLTC